MRVKPLLRFIYIYIYYWLMCHQMRASYIMGTHLFLISRLLSTSAFLVFLEVPPCILIRCCFPAFKGKQKTILINVIPLFLIRNLTLYVSIRHLTSFEASKARRKSLFRLADIEWSQVLNRSVKIVIKRSGCMYCEVIFFGSSISEKEGTFMTNIRLKVLRVMSTRRDSLCAHLWP